MGSIDGSFDCSNEVKPVGLLFGEALGSDDGTVLGRSDGALEETKDGMLEGQALVIPLGNPIGLVLGYVEGILPGSTHLPHLEQTCHAHHP